jgi:hypothetical protein
MGASRDLSEFSSTISEVIRRLRTIIEDVDNNQMTGDLRSCASESTLMPR